MTSTDSIETLKKIIAQKRADRNIQIAMFIVTLILLPFTLLFSFYLMGFTHACSTFYWMKKSDQMVQLKGRKVMTRINIIILIGFALSLLLLFTDIQDPFYGISGAMLYIGIIAGPAYFILTIKELRCYKKQLTKQRSKNM